MGEAFTKLHGLGNDFIVLDRRATGEAPSAEVARALCDRHRGIGADGVLSILPGPRMRVTNADGSIAEMCGNGLRCVAKFLGDVDPNLRELTIDTDAGPRRCELVRENGRVVAAIAEMGAPILEARALPMDAPAGRFVQGMIDVDGLREPLRGTAVSMGNPHLVLWDTPPERAAQLGPKLEVHPRFPNRTNVEFVRAGNPLEVVVWERGCGLTQACGTGACATVVAGVLEGRLQAGEEIAVRLPGGVLGIRVAKDLSQVWMRGEVVEVFRGTLG
ncbi:MAG: diaminopimelate epimerase [Deltaproteobacteria bacterium]|nr:diaminopimelate epimerase [Deltaproteobacteria bacterium]